MHDHTEPGLPVLRAVLPIDRDRFVMCIDEPAAMGCSGASVSAVIDAPRFGEVGLNAGEFPVQVCSLAHPLTARGGVRERLVPRAPGCAIIAGRDV